MRSVRIPAAGALFALLAACGSKPDAHGEAMFHGREPMVGHITGDGTALPAIATRCSNCHEQDNVAPVTGSSGKTYAPRLNREWLTGERVRRGGPGSTYDEARFCTLLREGIDPAHIVIATTMPRYELSDGDCRRLWRYVVSR